MNKKLIFSLIFSIITLISTCFASDFAKNSVVSDNIFSYSYEEKQGITPKNNEISDIADTFSTSFVVNNTIEQGYGAAFAPDFYVTKEITSCDSTSCLVDENAEYGVVKWGPFYYAHSNLAFAPVKNLYVGNIFTITDSTGTHTYEVAVRDVFEREYLNSRAGKSAVTSPLYKAKYYGTQYDISLMTCGDGTNDDSNYRLLIFANRIA